MQFLHPGAVWLLPLLALLLLLARRRRPRSIRRVSNLFLWRAAGDRAWRVARPRWQRHRQLLLQAACLLAMIAALARPVVTWRGSRIVMIFDVSASMAARQGGATRLDASIAQAETVVRTLARNSPVHLVSVGGGTDDLGTVSAASPALAGQLRSLRAGDTGADLAAAIAATRATEPAPTQIHVFSDHPAPTGTPTGIHWHQVGRRSENLAVTALAGRRSVTSAAGGEVLINIHNYGRAEHRAMLDVALEGRPLASRTITVGARADEAVAVATVSLSGVIVARLTHVDPPDDALAADDVRFAIGPAHSPVRVRLAAPASFFLQKALESNPDLMLVTEGSTGAPATDEVVVCEGCERVPEGATPVLWMHPPGGSAGHSAPLMRDENGRRIAELETSARVPLSVEFPVALANLINWLADRDEHGAGIVAGQPWHRRLAEGTTQERVDVTGPDGRPTRFRLNGRDLSTTATIHAGVYRVRVDGATDVFVANPATTTESDLSIDAPPEQGAWLSAPRAAVGFDTTSAFLLLALGLLAAEWRGYCRTGG